MKYTVVWTAEALHDLGTLWLNAADRNAVTRASNEIDLQLSQDPEDKGEQREGIVRLLLVPLAVVFAVRSQDRLATVFAVYRTHA